MNYVRLLQISQTYYSLSLLVVGNVIICPCCKQGVDDLKFHRRLTTYADESLNYLIACETCCEEDDEVFREFWLEWEQGLI